MLSNLFIQLTTTNEAFLKLTNTVDSNNNINSSGVNSDSYLAVKLYQQPLLQSYHSIEDYDVPIFRNHFIDLSSLSWDISYQYIILHIDGLSNVKQITSEVNMDSSAIRRCLSLLLFHQQIILADMFKFSNVYKVNTDQAMVYFNNNYKMDELRRNVALTINNSHTNNESENNNNSDSDNNNKSNINDGRNNNNSNTDNGNDPLHNGDVDDDNNNDELPTIQQIITFLLKLQQNRTIKQIIIDSFDDVSRLSAQLKRNRHDDVVDNCDSDDNDDSSDGRSNNNADNHDSGGSNNKNTINKSKLDLRNIDLPKLIGYCKHEGR